MKSTVVDESLSSYKPMYCSREYQTSTRLNQQYEKSTLKLVQVEPSYKATKFQVSNSIQGYFWPYLSTKIPIFWYNLHHFCVVFWVSFIVVITDLATISNIFFASGHVYYKRLYSVKLHPCKDVERYIPINFKSLTNFKRYFGHTLTRKFQCF